METLIIDNIVNSLFDYLAILKDVDISGTDRSYVTNIKLISNSIYDIAYINSNNIECILDNNDKVIKCSIKRIEEDNRIRLIPYCAELKRAINPYFIKYYTTVISKAKLKFKLLEMSSRISYNSDYKYYV